MTAESDTDTVPIRPGRPESARGKYGLLAGIAGSAVVGKRCSIGGQVGIFGHITLTDDVVVAATSLVRRSIKEPGVYSGSVYADRLDKWQRNHARLVELDSLARRLIRLEKEYSNDKE